MEIKMTITSENQEEITYEEFKIELDYLAKNWNIFLKKYLSGWEIVGYPKKRKVKLREKPEGENTFESIKEEEMVRKKKEGVSILGIGIFLLILGIALLGLKVIFHYDPVFGDVTVLALPTGIFISMTGLLSIIAYILSKVIR